MVYIVGAFVRCKACRAEVQLMPGNLEWCHDCEACLRCGGVEIHPPGCPNEVGDGRFMPVQPDD